MLYIEEERQISRMVLNCPQPNPVLHSFTIFDGDTLKSS